MQDISPRMYAGNFWPHNCDQYPWKLPVNILKSTGAKTLVGSWRCDGHILRCLIAIFWHVWDYSHLENPVATVLKSIRAIFWVGSYRYYLNQEAREPRRIGAIFWPYFCDHLKNPLQTISNSIRPILCRCSTGWFSDQGLHGPTYIVANFWPQICDQWPRNS